MADALATIRALIAEESLVPVVGAGVSAATAGTPGWAGAVKGAIEHARTTGACTPGEAAAALERLNAGELVTAAREAQRLLGAPHGEFPAWLKEQFDVPEESVRSRELVDAIGDLLCPVVATTNYDLLLSRMFPSRPAPVTWREPVKMQIGLREGGKVLHLHGVFDEPESIVFGTDTYDRLVKDPASRSVMQTLWLDRTLLFIGCSFEGLSDPDFAALLDWATQAFAGSPFKHYALLRRSQITPERASEFLKRWRIQVVDYGPDHADLAAFLRALNPRPERSLAYRVMKVRELLDPDKPEHRRAVEQLLAGIPQRTALAVQTDWRSIAAQLFDQRFHDSRRLRGHLIAMQRLSAALVDPQAVRSEIERWEEGKVRSFSGSFRETVERATAALALFPQPLLAALRRRDVEVHLAWLSGDSERALQHIVSAEAHGERTYFVVDRYTIENMKRVLTTLDAILRTDADRTFPDPRPARIERPIPDRCLLVARKRSLELRDLAQAERVIATLALPEADVRGACCVPFSGQSAIVAHQNERAFAWDPHRADAPLAEFSLLAERYGFCDLDHLPADGELHTIGATIDGPLYHLVNLELVGQFRPKAPNVSFLCYPVQLPGTEAQLFALTPAPNPEVMLVLPDGACRPVIDSDAVRDALARFPAPRSIGVQPSEAADERFVYPKLRRQLLGGKSTLALHVERRWTAVEGDEEFESIVLFFESRAETLVPSGCYRERRGRVTDYAVLPGSGGLDFLTAVCLSDFEESFDLALWARAVPTTPGALFVADGSTLRTRDDLIAVAAVDAEHCFAADDSGGLFAFSPSDRRFREIDRDKRSRIVSLTVVRW